MTRSVHVLILLALCAAAPPAQAETGTTYVVQRFVEGPAETQIVIVGIGRTRVPRLPDWAHQAKKRLVRQVEAADASVLSAGMLMDADWRRAKLPVAVGSLIPGQDGAVGVQVRQRHCRIDVVFRAAGALPERLRDARALSSASDVSLRIRADRGANPDKPWASTARETRVALTLEELALLKDDCGRFRASGAGALVRAGWSKILEDWALESDVNEVAISYSFPSARDAEGKPLQIEGSALSERHARGLLGLAWWSFAQANLPPLPDASTLAELDLQAARRAGQARLEQVQALRLGPVEDLTQPTGAAGPSGSAGLAGQLPD